MIFKINKNKYFVNKNKTQILQTKKCKIIDAKNKQRLFIFVKLNQKY
jgi:hypothetical protein